MDIRLQLLLLLASSPATLSESDDLNRVIFVINSQSNSHHATNAQRTKTTLEDDLRAAGVKAPRVFLTHMDEEEVPQHGAWTYFPTIEHMGMNPKTATANWVVFLSEDTRVNPVVLKEVLADRPNPQLEEVFLGHALRDEDNVVIHHYDLPGLEYPHSSAGFALSSRLLNAIRERLDELHKDSTKFPENFSIDPEYELAKAINRMHDSNDINEVTEMTPGQVRITHDERFCVTEGVGCATFPRMVACNATDADVLDLAKHTLFAVKTCGKFHSLRLPVIRDTWESAAINIVYISEEEDAEFNTKTLPGVGNTERGHCKKSQSILEYFHANAEREGWRWLVVTDDDTILSVVRMMGQLKCYDDLSGEAVHLGQRYGFKVASGRYGYDYITGGGSMVFNMAVTKKMLERKSHCRCPKDDHPDDMHFGACMANLGTPLVHSHRFHQGRPEDYPAKLLQSQEPISFHKFWNTDPRKTYDTFFRKADQLLIDYKFGLKNPHQEL